MTSLPHKHTLIVKREAARAGFDFCAISEAAFLEEEAPRLERWLKSGMHGSMTYMEHHFDKRLDPRKLVPGARSVISLLLNYYPLQSQEPTAPRVSKYAYGEKDYHEVIRHKLKELMRCLEQEIGAIEGRVFVDSAPVLDKAWASRSGLGWIGKNTNLIRKESGSFFFIAEIISDLQLEADRPATDHCGTCRRCIDACPTGAIVEPYVVDGSRCISHFTIELKGEIPASWKGTFDNWAFGCDVCQDVCPWNRFAEARGDDTFAPPEGMLEWTSREWAELTEEVFGKTFGKSALRRAKYTGLMRNLRFLEE